MIRFSAALTVFGQQQVQNAMSNALSTESGMNAMREALDSATQVLTAQIDEKQRSTMKSVSDLGTDLVSRTFDTMQMSRLDPRQLVESTGAMVKQVSDTIESAIKRTAAAASSAASAATSSGEPTPAAEALK
ncbi:MAG: hypothetical protein ABL967_07105 [Bryobacteraceae bacterium]